MWCAESRDTPEVRVCAGSGSSVEPPPARRRLESRAGVRARALRAHLRTPGRGPGLLCGLRAARPQRHTLWELCGTKCERHAIFWHSTLVRPRPLAGAYILYRQATHNLRRRTHDDTIRSSQDERSTLSQRTAVRAPCHLLAPAPARATLADACASPPQQRKPKAARGGTLRPCPQPGW